MSNKLLVTAFCAALVTAAPALAQTDASSGAAATVGPVSGTSNSTIQSQPLPAVTPNTVDTPAPISGSSSTGVQSTTPGPSTNGDGTFNRGAANETTAIGTPTAGSGR
jgi:hypothetical protein